MKKTGQIYVDGWCSNNPGKGGWRVIVNGVETRRRETNYITNNLCEYFAIVDAIKWIECRADKEIEWTIWSDSMTAISWHRNKNVKTNLTDQKILDIVKKTEKYLMDTTTTNYTVKKWHTRSRGEIPADFGRKKKRKKTI